MTTSGFLIVTATALLVSASSIFSRFCYDVGANPQTVVFFRFLLFCLLYLAIVALTKKRLRLPKGKNGTILLAGCLYTLGSGSLLASMFFLPVSLAVVIFYTYPIITMAGEKILQKQLPSVLEVFCFVLAFIGLILALKIETTSVSPIGLALAVTASLGMSASYLLSDRKLKDIDSFELTFHLAVVGLILMSIYVLTTASFNPGILTTTNILFLFLASLCFALGFFLMFKGISLIGAVKTAMILNFEPIFTIGLAFIFLAERFTTLQFIGTALVVTAVIMIQRK